MAAEVAGVGTWSLSVLENELSSSRKCKEVFGFSEHASFQYEDFLARIHPQDREVVHAVVQRALDPQGSGMYEYDYRIMHPNGEVRWISAKGEAFFEERGGRVAAVRLTGTVLDRTDRKKAQEALIEAERLAIVGRLAASIVHEIKNPLAAVSDLLYLLRGEQSEERRTEYLVQAESELARVSEIASSTLRFYRDPVGVTSFDVADLAHSVVVLFQGRIALQQVQIERDLPRGIFVSGPQGELRQVCVNLIGNALDAMPSGGRLILRTREFVDHHAQRVCVRLTIADTGHGMEPEILKRIFEAFYTTKGESGTGVGLWLSQEIMRKCGASIRVKSSPGRGTVFHLSLTGTSPPSSSLPESSSEETE